MLLRGLTVLVLFQLLGSALNVLILPVLPGPIIGLVLLFVYLLVVGKVNQPINEAATGLLRYLPVLLLPPVAGVLVHFNDIIVDIWPIAVALTLSATVSIVFAGWLMQKLIERQQKRKEQA
ncbi:CidA/LrgA family protein [Thiopseudomonas acetoxidans]|uniref:CidA/LrgA family protein n=1 Tax=Thiopseudomonas acetoxidans TaxID=3041622 RepID=A0ABT7SLB4_9GAMM|nr:CidA/LrgA family protein [Thiopseudomonas sp. CY1220]MDM7856819.1 CidA/LrgA family protein [Thiopseudomonas sp. CY1220]NLC10040.1 CidA/LrgA family protein [Gammaproteobacteria bacterium]